MSTDLPTPVSKTVEMSPAADVELEAEAKLLDAKKLVWSQVNPKLHRAEHLLRESQTSCGKVRTFGLLGFEFKFDFFFKFLFNHADIIYHFFCKF